MLCCSLVVHSLCVLNETLGCDCVHVDQLIADIGCRALQLLVATGVRHLRNFDLISYSRTTQVPDCLSCMTPGSGKLVLPTVGRLQVSRISGSVVSGFFTEGLRVSYNGFCGATLPGG